MIADFVRKASVAFGRTQAEEAEGPDVVVQSYRNALSKFPGDVVIECFIAWLDRTDAKRPTPALLAEACSALQREVRDSAKMGRGIDYVETMAPQDGELIRSRSDYRLRPWELSSADECERILDARGIPAETCLTLVTQIFEAQAERYEGRRVPANVGEWAENARAATQGYSHVLTEEALRQFADSEKRKPSPSLIVARVKQLRMEVIGQRNRFTFEAGEGEHFKSAQSEGGLRENQLAFLRLVADGVVNHRSILFDYLADVPEPRPFPKRAPQGCDPERIARLIGRLSVTLDTEDDIQSETPPDAGQVQKVATQAGSSSPVLRGDEQPAQQPLSVPDVSS